MMMKEEAAATAATTTTTTTTSLVDLPVSALLGIAEYGSIVDCRRLVMTCQRLWTGRHGLERARRRAAVTTAAERAVLASLVSLLPPPPPPPLPRLVAFELGDAVVDDEFMLAFDWRVDFPALRDISMVGSNRVHGVAVRVALQHHPSLQYVDVTYCPLVEYVDALLLRDSLVVPQAMVRRLPEEMCGMVETNFDNDRKCATPMLPPWAGRASLCFLVPSNFLMLVPHPAVGACFYFSLSRFPPLLARRDLSVRSPPDIRRLCQNAASTYCQS